MLTIAIRKHIENTMALTSGDEMLHERLRAVLAAQGAGDEAVEPMFEQLRAYVRGTPELIDRCALSALQVGTEAAVIPILQVAANYFLQPQDIIPDHIGLYGLLDDAYLAQSMLQLASDVHMQLAGLPLLTQSLAGSNRLVRMILGEPIASQLDEIVAQTIQTAVVQAQLRQAAAGSASLNNDPTGGPGSWGPSFEDEISRIAASCGISISW